MKKFLNFLRWTLATPIIIAFFVVALIGIPAAAVTGTVSRSETVKEYLQKSGVYGGTRNQRKYQWHYLSVLPKDFSLRS